MHIPYIITREERDFWIKSLQIKEKRGEYLSSLVPMKVLISISSVKGYKFLK
jgi:hypothetical protein